MIRRKTVLRVLLVISGIIAVSVLIAVACYDVSNKTNGTIVSSGERRQYLLYVPKTYDPANPTPLVISMHALGLWPAAQQDLSHWNKLADTYGFIVVYPSGTGFPKIWRMRTEPGSKDDVMKDVGFISDLIDKLEANYNIDPTRIYANGFSNGGGMAFVLSCRLSHRIAAVGTVSAAEVLPWSWCRETRPSPMIAFHGTADTIVPYGGGPSKFFNITFPALSSWTASWAQRNQCKGKPNLFRVTVNVTRLAYTDCAENADVVLYTINRGGHSWPGGKFMPAWMVGPRNAEIDATQLIWDFFRYRSLR
jgi:polyhydroxybutyrate depolymerase